MAAQGTEKKTIAIAGAGDVAKFIVEEIRKDGKHNVVVLSRAPRDWFVENNVEIRITDYTLPSLANSIHDCDILVSLLHDNDPSFFLPVHLAMISACQQSPKCKHFIPSECGGDIDRFPNSPLFYVPTHVPVREALRAQNDIEYVLLNNGWFMDYFVDSSRTYMKNLGVVWPLDLKEKTLRVPGDGDASVTFTTARDVAKAFVKLFDTDKWNREVRNFDLHYTKDDPHIYVAGETTTWNKVISLVERVKGIKLQVTYKPLSVIDKDIELHKNDKDPKELWLAYMDSWNATGAAGLPMDKVKEQREKYFIGVHFRSIEDLLQQESTTSGIL